MYKVTLTPYQQSALKTELETGARIGDLRRRGKTLVLLDYEGAAAFLNCVRKKRDSANNAARRYSLELLMGKIQNAIASAAANSQKGKSRHA